MLIQASVRPWGRAQRDTAGHTIVRATLALAMLGLAGCASTVNTHDAGRDAMPSDASSPDASSPDACAPGTATCANVCVVLATDPAHCGSCGRECPAVPGGRATCSMGTCGFECLPGFERVGAACELAAPRPIAPLSTSAVTSQRPELRWESAAGADGASVELCRDRAMSTQCQRFEATGSRAVPANVLSPGMWFWRVRARVGGSVGMRSSPVWEFAVGARSAAVNTSWGTVLDVNGDGFADAAVGAPGLDGRTAGRVYVFSGGATGLGTAPSSSLRNPDPANRQFGAAVTSAGDVNGDGFGDLLVSGVSGGAGGPGFIYVYLGGAMGLGATPATSLMPPPIAGSSFRGAITSAGDVNGDGYADVLVGGGATGLGEGRAYVFLGSATGLGATPAATLMPPGFNSYFGMDVAGAGDVNGDGFADVVVGGPGWTAPEVGSAFVFLGSATGLATTPANAITPPEGAGSQFGVTVAGAGDVNGDGFADLLVAAPWGAMSSRGSVHVYLGSAMGLRPMPAASLDLRDSVGGPHPGAVAGAGDVNGDGFADVIVGVHLVESGTDRAHVYLGSESGLSRTPVATLAPPDGLNSYFGSSVAGGGDINGDGFAEVIAGMPSGSSMGTGRAFVFSGSVGAPVAAPGSTLTGPTGAGPWFGTSVAGASL